MTSVDVLEDLEGMTVVEVADAKGGGLAILFEGEHGPTILIVGGENVTMGIRFDYSDVKDWTEFWVSIRV